MGDRVDYDVHGRTYAQHRRADPRIAAHIHAALGAARSIVNVGAGTGSYEPRDRSVIAVEPSEVMRSQRPVDAAPVVAALAEALPFTDDAFDAAMACLTIHHWEQRDKGLVEMRRVARGPVAVFTYDLDHLVQWQEELLHEINELERSRFGTPDEVVAALGGRCRVEVVETPADCTDGFIEAFWRRPEALLDPEVRAAQSAWALLSPATERRIIDDLAESLRSGDWDSRFGDLRSQETIQGGLRLIVSQPS